MRTLLSVGTLFPGQLLISVLPTLVMGDLSKATGTCMNALRRLHGVCGGVVDIGQCVWGSKKTWASLLT